MAKKPATPTEPPLEYQLLANDARQAALAVHYLLNNATELKNDGIDDYDGDDPLTYAQAVFIDTLALCSEDAHGHEEELDDLLQQGLALVDAHPGEGDERADLLRRFGHRALDHGARGVAREFAERMTALQPLLPKREVELEVLMALLAAHEDG